jgi:hypothetical protein
MATGMNFGDPDDESKLETTLRTALGDVRYKIAASRGSSAALDTVFAFALSDKTTPDSSL